MKPRVAFYALVFTICTLIIGQSSCSQLRNPVGSEFRSVSIIPEGHLERVKEETKRNLQSVNGEWSSASHNTQVNQSSQNSYSEVHTVPSRNNSEGGYHAVSNNSQEIHGYDKPNYYKTAVHASTQVSTPVGSSTHYDLNRIQNMHANIQTPLTTVVSHSHESPMEVTRVTTHGIDTSREMLQSVAPRVVPTYSSNTLPSPEYAPVRVASAHPMIPLGVPLPVPSVPIVQSQPNLLNDYGLFVDNNTFASGILPQNPIYNTQFVPLANNLPDMQSISQRINKLSALSKPELDRLLSDMKKHKENLTKLNEKVYNNIKKTESQINVVLNSLKDEVKDSDEKLNNLIVPTNNDQKAIEKEIDEEYSRTVHGLNPSGLPNGLRRFKEVDQNFASIYENTLKNALRGANIPLNLN